MSQPQYHYQQPSQSQVYTPVTQQRVSRGSGRYGNGILQSTQHQFTSGNGTTENTIVPSSSSSSFAQSQSGLSIIHSSSAATAAALANADPSTPIRAIVSRGLVEQGIRYIY